MRDEDDPDTGEGDVRVRLPDCGWFAEYAEYVAV